MWKYVQRADLNALELAKAYRRLQDEYGRTQEEIAKTVGKSRPHVANTMRLLELPYLIQDGISDGKISRVAKATPDGAGDTRK